MENNIYSKFFPSPIHKTRGMEKRRESIVKMYEFSKTHNSDLYNYLTTNCGHLISGKIPSIQFGNIKDIAKIDLKEKFSTTYFKDYNNYNIAGTYRFYVDDNLVYIGSTTNFKTRLSSYYSHYNNYINEKVSRNKYFARNRVKVGGIQNSKFVILFTSGRPRGV